MNITNICVGHKVPEFNLKTNYVMFCPHSLDMPNEIVIPDDRFGAESAGASLAEYSQLFALNDMIENGHVNSEKLFLFQYRKFISPHYDGRDSVASWVRVLNSQEGARIFPNLNTDVDHSLELIVGPILNFNESLSQSYSRVHVIEDFVLFTLACAESGLFSNSDLDYFCTMTQMFPSPTLCYISTPLFVEMITILKKVSDIYLKLFYKKREGYQMRSTGYLLERLHSFLIFKYLKDDHIRDFGIWHRYVINCELNL